MTDIPILIRVIINFKDLTYFKILLSNKNVIKKIERSNINVLNYLIENDCIKNLEMILNSELDFTDTQIKAVFLQSISKSNINIFNYYLKHYPDIFYEPYKEMSRDLGVLNIEMLKSYIENKNFSKNKYIEELTMIMYRKSKIDCFLYLIQMNIINFKIIDLILNKRMIKINKTTLNMDFIDIILSNKNSVRLIPDNFQLKAKNDILQKRINLCKIQFKVDNF